jgi:glycosyltransferase involved in cell wall biosynthesis
VLVPDAHLLGWNPSAAWAARRLVRERRIECVITSSPPQSTHLIPFALGRGRPAWIADFRDGWRFDPLRGPWPTRAQQALDARLERWVVGRADEVIGVTRPIAEDLGARLRGRSVHVPNGWDPDLDPSSAKSSLTLEPNTVSIVYTGTLGGEGAGRRDPGVLLAALERLLPRRPDAADRLRIILVGPVESQLRRLLADFDGGAMISCVGQLPREQALLAQRQADALLLFTAPGHVSQATGKVFEYLAAGRPIIALADRNEAARLIEETGTGVTVKQDDPEGLAGVLEQALDDRLGERFAPHDLEQYVYPGPAETVAELVEKAVARRARAGR